MQILTRLALCASVVCCAKGPLFAQVPFGKLGISANGDVISVKDLASSGDEDRKSVIHVIDGKENKVITRLRAQSPTVGVSSDGKMIVTHESVRDVNNGEWTTVTVTTIATGQPEKSFLVKGKAVGVVGRWVLAQESPDMETATARDVETLRTVTLKGFKSTIHQAAASADGKYLATIEGGVLRPLAKIWDASTGAKLLTLDEKGVRRILFAAKKTTVAVTSAGRTKLYDLPSCKLLQSVAIAAQAISSDGKLLAAGSGKVALLDEAKLEKKLPGALRTYPDGIHVFSTEKKEVVASFEKDTTFVPWEMFFAGNDGFLVGVAGNGVLHKWDLQKKQ